eukprot:4611902-Amphidinium_carterae.1
MPVHNATIPVACDTASGTPVAVPTMVTMLRHHMRNRDHVTNYHLSFMPQDEQTQQSLGVRHSDISSLG